MVSNKNEGHSKTTGGADAEQEGKSSEAMNHLLELITDVKVSMLTTQDADGNLRSRPMQTTEAEASGVLWFFTSDHHGKAEEIEKDPRVNLSYAMPEKNRYISVSGLGEIVHDLDKKKELWKPVYKAWFADGPEDSHCALLKVYIEKAEYWDATSSTIVQIVGFTKALLTGKPYRGEANGPDSHKKIEFGKDANAPTA
ncbi:MAG: pyridoxamine 5'-phosphate oxidase family protein [Bdellovibrionota bacterium]